jgi:hypothetical protein
MCTWECHTPLTGFGTCVSVNMTRQGLGKYKTPYLATLSARRHPTPNNLTEELWGNSGSSNLACPADREEVSWVETPKLIAKEGNMAHNLPETHPTAYLAIPDCSGRATVAWRNCNPWQPTGAEIMAHIFAYSRVVTTVSMYYFCLTCIALWGLPLGPASWH